MAEKAKKKLQNCFCQIAAIDLKLYNEQRLFYTNVDHIYMHCQMIPIFQYDTPRGLDVPLGKILSVLL